jgi:glycosyltransferase involved in cell wall biosynthesis
VANSININIESCCMFKKKKKYLNVRGWGFSQQSTEPLKIKVLSQNGSKNIEIYIFERVDVAETFEQYKGSLKSGFSINIYDFNIFNDIEIRFEDESSGEYIMHILNIRELIFKYVKDSIRKTKEKTTVKNLKKVMKSIKVNGSKNTFKKIRTKFSLSEASYIQNEENTVSWEQFSNKDKYLEDLFKRSSEKSSEYVSILSSNVELTEEDIKLIAFFLPQFHPIPENDEWWGKGFTEWTNVSKAVPQFVGHYQPHLPDELGFYDLRLIDVQKRQIELAKKYGLYGFCYHHYWFGGKRLLATPVNQLLSNPELDFPFCLCWANENWTRRWDGLENEVLIAQAHSPEDDIAFIKDIEIALKDSRYIKIQGKPLLIVYRVGLLPNAKETAERWREYCKANGIGDIYLVAAQGFGFSNPSEYGFDAAVEFPPHTMQKCPNITDKVKATNDNFSGLVYNYSDFVKSKGYLDNADFTLFKTVCPSWDNTARKPNNGAIFWGSTPELYKEWLNDAVYYTKRNFEKDKRLVFINAWNEWAEGAHLEPDRKYGYANLEATANVVLDYRKNKFRDKKIIFVSHDAHFHGAQILALNIVKVLKEKFNYEVHVILKSGGILESEFESYAKVYNIEKEYYNKEKLEGLIKTLYYRGVETAICNTVITGDIVEVLSKNNIKTISLIHELPKVIEQFKAESKAELISKYAEKVIFPSKYVSEKFNTIVNVKKEKIMIAPQGLFKENKYKHSKKEAGYELRKKLNIPENSYVVLGVGYADLRKGIDLFAEVAINVIKTNTKIYFVWVGNKEENVMNEVVKEINKFDYKENIIFIEAQNDISVFYAGADIYLMTSREDPFPTVVIDAMNVATPVIGFENAGGFADIVNKNTGFLVPFMDIEEMCSKVVELINDEGLRIKKGGFASTLISEKFIFLDYIYLLLEQLGHNYKKISVIVPNYNYERYLEERLTSIINQTYPIYELILLDDKSTDGSIILAEKFKQNKFLDLKMFNNEFNSGSVFKQWEKGVSISKGDYIWIAEADDLCENTFLEKNVESFDDEDVVLSYSQSKQIDENGKIIAENYFGYTNDIDVDKWKKKYIVQGKDEISNAMVIKNTIPNVSSVVFKKYDISQIVDELNCFKIAGDWFFYVWLLEKGKIAYIPNSLNMHRRHTNSVTVSENKELHLNEIIKMQDYISNKFLVDKNVQARMHEYRKYVEKYLFSEH